MTTRIFIETGIDIAIHQMAPDEFQEIESMQSSFYQNLDQEGILVAG